MHHWHYRGCYSKMHFIIMPLTHDVACADLTVAFEDRTARLPELESTAAHIAERLRTAKRVADVAPTALALLAQATGSEWAVWWVVDAQLNRLRPLALWSALGSKAQVLEDTTGRSTLSPGEGIPGQVWRSRKPRRATNLALEMCLPRSLAAIDAGLQGGLWFALKTDTAVYGVIEFLSRALALNTADDLVTLERLGFRLGHALEESIHGNARLH